MNHKLLAARVPLAWIALGLVLLIALVQILVANLYAPFGLGVAAAGLSVNPVALLILVLLALSCLASPVPGAAKAVVISVAVTVSIFTVAAVVQAITIVQTASDQGKWWEALTAGPLHGIAPLVLLTIVAWVLVAATGSSSAADTAQPRAEEATEFANSGSVDAPSAGQEAPGAELAPPEVPSSEDQAPTWQLDKASGVVWQSAAAAATGAQGSGYGMPGQARGSWQPAPALQAAETDSADSSGSPGSVDSPVSSSSSIPHDSDSVDEDLSAEDHPAEDYPAEGHPADEDPETEVDDESVDNSGANAEPAGDEPAAASSTPPSGRRFAAAAQLSESPSSGDSPAQD